MVGPPEREEDWGTGYIPADAILARTRRMGVSNALDSVTVRHASGGASSLGLKAYEQGRGKWQANTVDYVWFDEEPPSDVYFEGITRTNATKGLIAVTFTPLMGMSDVVARYMMEDSEDRAVITMTIDDAEHYSPEATTKAFAMSTCRKGESCGLLPPDEDHAACVERMTKVFDDALPDDTISACTKEEVDLCRQAIESDAADCYDTFVTRKLPAACDDC
jgi:phage terminase large subunit-like protein